MLAVVVVEEATSFFFLLLLLLPALGGPRLDPPTAVLLLPTLSFMAGQISPLHASLDGYSRQDHPACLPRRRVGEDKSACGCVCGKVG